MKKEKSICDTCIKTCKGDEEKDTVVYLCEEYETYTNKNKPTKSRRYKTTKRNK